MAIINSYPNITPTAEDLLLVSDTSVEGNPTKTASINSVLALIPAGSGGGGDITSITSSNSNFLSVTNPSGPIVVLDLNTGPVQNGGNSLATTGDIYNFTTTSITNAINNLGAIGTVTGFSCDISGIPAFTQSVADPTTTPLLSLGVAGGSVGEFLDYTGNWSTPGSTGVNSITTTSPITDTGTASIPNIGISQATTSTDGYLSSTDWNTFNDKMPSFIITNNGTTGAAAFNVAGTELNIPVYTGGGGAGGVSSVGLTMPSAFTVSTPNPIISAGTFVVGGSGAVTQFIDGTGALQAISSIAGTYDWAVAADTGGQTVTSGTEINFVGGTGISTSYDSVAKELTIDYNGTSGLTSIIATSSNTASLGPSTALTTNGTLTIPWNGTSSEVVLGDGSLQSILSIPGTYSWGIQADSGSSLVASGTTIDIEGGTNITTSLVGNTLTIDGPSSLGTVTSVDAANTTFINGVASTSPNPITTTGTLEYSLSAAGSPSSKNYLRGDNTWSDPSRGVIPTYFSIKTQVTGAPVFNNQGNVQNNTQDFGGSLSDWSFANNSTAAELIYRVNFSGRSDTSTDYMVNFVFESSTEDQNGDEVPAIGYVKDKNATYFEFVLLPANLTGKAAGSNMIVNFQIYN